MTTTLDTCSPRTRALIDRLLEDDRRIADLEMGDVTIHVSPRGIAVTIERRSETRPWPNERAS